jgi:hypothetical protein
VKEGSGKEGRKEERMEEREEGHRQFLIPIKVRNPSHLINYDVNYFWLTLKTFPTTGSVIETEGFPTSLRASDSKVTLAFSCIQSAMEVTGCS